MHRILYNKVFTIEYTNDKCHESPFEVYSSHSPPTTPPQVDRFRSSTIESLPAGARGIAESIRSKLIGCKGDLMKATPKYSTFDPIGQLHLPWIEANKEVCRSQAMARSANRNADICWLGPQEANKQSETYDDSIWWYRFRV